MYVVVQFHPRFKFLFSFVVEYVLYMVTSLKQRKIKFKTKIKIGPHTIYTPVKAESFIFQIFLSLVKQQQQQQPLQQLQQQK